MMEDYCFMDTIHLSAEERQAVERIAQERGHSCSECNSPDLVSHSEAQRMLGLLVNMGCIHNETHYVPPLTLTPAEAKELLPNRDFGQSFRKLFPETGSPGRAPNA